MTVGIGMAASSKAVKCQVVPGCRASIRRFKDARRLVAALRDGEVDAAVRGTLSSSDVLVQLKAAFGLKEVMRTAIMECVPGKEFLLAPVGIDEGKNASARLKLAEASVGYFAPLGWKPGIGVLSKGRREDVSRGADIRKSVAEGERIARELRRRHIQASHYGILIEEAISECDLLLAPDGVSGNLIFRSLHFLGGCKAFGAPVVNIDSVFLDTSRAKADFTESLLLAVGLAEARRHPPSRA
jgi:putative methanogen marker protein 4